MVSRKSVSPNRNSFPQQKYVLKIGFCLISTMVSTSRKHALKSVSISGIHFQNKVIFKNWISPNPYQEEEGYFSKIAFFLISVFTSRNKSCKILFCLVKQYSFIQSFLPVKTVIETIQKLIFKEKLRCSYQKLFSGQ